MIAPPWSGWDKSVTLTEGDERNLKITTPVDLVIAEALLGEENT